MRLIEENTYRIPSDPPGSLIIAPSAQPTGFHGTGIAFFCPHWIIFMCFGLLFLPEHPERTQFKFLGIYLFIFNILVLYEVHDVMYPNSNPIASYTYSSNTGSHVILHQTVLSFVSCVEEPAWADQDAQVFASRGTGIPNQSDGHKATAWGTGEKLPGCSGRVSESAWKTGPGMNTPKGGGGGGVER